MTDQPMVPDPNVAPWPPKPDGYVGVWPAAPDGYGMMPAPHVPTAASDGVVPAFSVDEPDAPPVPFTIGAEVFYAAGVAPGGTLLDLAHLRTASPEEKLSAISGFLDGVLLPESAARLAARLRSPERPVDMPALAKVVEKLVRDVYGLQQHPSDGSSSTPGSPVASAPGVPSTPGSTGGAPPAE